MKSKVTEDLYHTLVSIQWGSNSMDCKGNYCPYCHAYENPGKHTDTCRVKKAMDQYEEALVVGFDECDNCGSEDWDNGVCSLDGLGFCCEECLDAYLNGGNGGILSPNPGDTYNPEPYETSFYWYKDGKYILRTDI